MPNYSITVPDEEERGILVQCDDHDEAEEFHPGYRTVAFHCDKCGYEIEVTLHDLMDWRDLGEMC